MRLRRDILLPWALAALLAVAAVLIDASQAHKAEAPALRTDLTGGETGWMLFPSGDVGLGGLAAEHPTITPRQVAGRLTLPEGPGPFPAAVLVHGSLGLSGVQFDYAKRLRKQGYAVFVLDSFTPRGRSDVVGDQLAITGQTMTIDAYAALNLLSTHPSVQADKIVLIGWSKGGGVAQLTMKRRYGELLAAGDLRFAAHVAFYPWCGEQDAKLELTDAPILFVLAGRDDWVDPQSCRDYAARLEEAGQEVQFADFSDAEHGFDYPVAHRHYVSRAMAWGQCRYFVRPEGFVVAETGEFRRWHELKEYFAACVVRGARIGSNAVARTSAQKILARFLDESLGEIPAD